MTDTFRLRRSIQVLGFAATVAFLAALIGTGSIFFLEAPEEHGFKGKHSVAIVGSLGILVFGGMFLMGVYVLVAYYVERLSIERDEIRVRSVFQNRSFGIGEIEQMLWIPYGRGRVEFMAYNKRTKLDLNGFTITDRLEIIRLLRNGIPEEIQEGWYPFCEKVALPLQEAIELSGAGLPSPIEPRSSDEVVINRTRYDRIMVGALPASVLLAIGAWWLLEQPAFFILPVVVVGFWLLLRYQVPRQGRRAVRLTATSGGRAYLFLWMGIVVSQLLIAALRLAGIEQNVACGIGLLVVVVSFSPTVVLMLRKHQQQTLDERTKGLSPIERWEAAERILDAGDQERIK